MTKYFAKGIKLSSIFSPSVQAPLDARTVATNLVELQAMPAIQKYKGLMTYVESEDCLYKWNGEEWEKYSASGSGIIPYAPGEEEATDAAPSLEIGDVESLALNSVNGDLWQKQEDEEENVSWVKIGSLRGASAYEIAQANGFEGTVEEWLESLKGDRGNLWITSDFLDETNLVEGATQTVTNADYPELSDIQVDDIYSNPLTKSMFKCTAIDEEAGTSTWTYIGSIKGDTGYGIYIATAEPAEGVLALTAIKQEGVRKDDTVLTPNGSLYTVTAVDETAGTVTVDTVDVQSIKGIQGDKGETGASAYEVAVENGFEGTEEEWLASLKGAKGEAGKDFKIVKTYASVAEMEADFSNPDSIVVEGEFVAISSNVEDPDNAKVYVKGATAFSFVTDLSGAQGIKGLSAYEVAVENGYEGTEEEWLASLKGANGTRGAKWYTGTDLTGTDVTAGIVESITDALVDDMYMNTTTGETYKAVLAEDGSTVVWTYISTLKGPSGDVVYVQEGETTTPMKLVLVVDGGTLNSETTEEETTTE